MTIETKIISHPKVIYLDTYNFYWAINVVYSSNLKSDNLAQRLHTNNQQMCIDCLNQDQIKMSVSVKNVVAITFMCSIIKVFH